MISDPIRFWWWIESSGLRSIWIGHQNTSDKPHKGKNKMSKKKSKSGKKDKAKAKEGASLRLVLASRRRLTSLLRSEDGASREKKSSRQRMAKKRETRRWPTRSMM